MFDYKANPFYLNDNEIKWVEDTYEGMSLEEKLGQLFCPIVFTKDEKELKEQVQEKHIGGMLYREGPGEELRQAHKVLQDAAKIPLLTASNLEYGGNGSAIEGTYFGREMLVAATQDTEKAYQLGKVSCSEGAAVGVNWSFAPVVDLDQNYHNPITNVRTFGNDQQTVINMGKAYIKAAQEEGVATSVKHFPGDGVDERDQHLLTSVNSLSCEEWDKTYGKIYEEMIEAGTLTVMAAHIAMPAYEEYFDKKPCERIIPATLSKNLMKHLLREKLGFNGLITTDATPMVGFCSAEEIIPHHLIPSTLFLQKICIYRFEQTILLLEISNKHFHTCLSSYSFSISAPGHTKSYKEILHFEKCAVSAKTSETGSTEASAQTPSCIHISFFSRLVSVSNCCKNHFYAG